nr:dehydrin family protein DHN5 [Pinus tabuliformis]
MSYVCGLCASTARRIRNPKQAKKPLHRRTKTLNNRVLLPYFHPLPSVHLLLLISSAILTKLFTRSVHICTRSLIFERLSTLNMAEEAPEHQDRGMFGLFGKKKEEEGKQGDHIVQTPAQTEAASYYPAAPHHGVEHGHGHEGQPTPEEAEQQKHTGLMGKLHRTNSSSSSSSSDEEGKGGKKKEGGRKKKGSKDKSKEKLPGAGQHSSDQCGGKEEKKTGLLDKIKEKIPGQQEKLSGGGTHSSDECGGKEEKKTGLLDKIKEKIPGHQEKLPGDGKHSSDEHGGEEEKKLGVLGKIKEKLPGHKNQKNDAEEEEKKHHH